MEQEVIEEEVSLFDEKGGTPVEQELEAAKVAEAETQKEEAPAFEMPDKFKDKSLEEVVQSYVHLEKEYGNKSNEVGDLRKWADTLLQAQTSAPTAIPQQEEDINEVGFDDFIEDPASAVNKALASNPTIQALEQHIQGQHADASRQALLQAHPDADQIVQDPAFNAFLNEVPGRLQALQDAHINGKVAVASDMLTLYKQTKVVANEEAVTERDAKAKGDLKKASVEKGGRGSGNTKPVFKRSELIELKMRDPQRYEAMKDVIHKAYADKRVR